MHNGDAAASLWGMANESKPLVTRLQEQAIRDRADRYTGIADLLEEAIAAILAAQDEAARWKKAAFDFAEYQKPLPADVEAGRADRDVRGPNDHESSGRMFHDETCADTERGQ